MYLLTFFFFFFFNDTATTEIYTLSLHDALPISVGRRHCGGQFRQGSAGPRRPPAVRQRSEEHPSELQSPCNLVCRLRLEKKNKKIYLTLTKKKQTKQNDGRENQENK